MPPRRSVTLARLLAGVTLAGLALAGCDRPPTEAEVRTALNREIDLTGETWGYAVQNQGNLRQRVLKHGRAVQAARTLLCAWSRPTGSYLCRVELTLAAGTGVTEMQTVDLHFVKIQSGWVPFAPQ